MLLFRATALLLEKHRKEALEMKFCKHCGTQLVDSAAICPQCGNAAGPMLNQTTDSSQKRKEPVMITATKILLVLGAAVVTISLYFVPLIWCVPMIFYYFKKVDAGEPISTWFKICTMLFVSLPAGILMMFDYVE